MKTKERPPIDLFRILYRGILFGAARPLHEVIKDLKLYKAGATACPA